MPTMLTGPMDLLIGGAVMTALVACATDVRSRRIPNVLTVSAALLALLCRLLVGGPWALIGGLLGGVVGFLLFLPLFAVRGLGGGDVKLLGALGAWIGSNLVLWTALYTALCGGVMALGLALWHGVLRRTLGHLSLMLTHWRVVGPGPVAGLTLEDSRSLRLAYAIPIACGLVLTLWLKA
ncbi:Flp pilus assembly protein, protease CpaA [Luteitalea pratensis]|uniref:Flp pilus assembly protein, protease CpaA n=1 Tax=Luteitalea pratensis TaxID=1855912 RepID=A0A143PVS7_LUTPR|nr:prepilin peptidase [Luteitalea pratensis]AMY12263.1 Flp pilus assembly protein, protease CpaA [Luteitalea pratensis]